MESVTEGNETQNKEAKACQEERELCNRKEMRTKK